MKEHCHFYCDECGGVYDVDFIASEERGGVKVPTGFQAKHYDISIRGVCRDCAGKAQK